MKTPGQEGTGPSRINLALMMRDHAGNNAKAIRKEIASLEKQIQLLRLELENLIKHASIEGVNLDVATEDTPVAEEPQ